MSETQPSLPLRIGLIVEGPTDGIVLRAAISSLLPNRDLEFTTIQPEFSVFSGGTGEGWSGWPSPASCGGRRWPKAG